MNRANQKPNVKRDPSIRATALGALHRHNPAGSKRLRKAVKHITGARVNYKQARAFYEQLNG